MNGIRQLRLMQVDQMAMIPALGNLQRLILEDMELTHGLPVLVAQSLTRLSELRLSFSCLGPEIACMTTLKVLQVKCRGALKLEMKDVETVAALPQLRTLSLQAGAGVGEFNRLKKSIYVLMALSRRFPSLDLLL